MQVIVPRNAGCLVASCLKRKSSDIKEASHFLCPRNGKQFNAWDGPVLVCVHNSEDSTKVGEMVREAANRLEFELRSIGNRLDVQYLRNSSSYELFVYKVVRENGDEAMGSINVFGDVHGDIQPKNRINAGNSKGFTYRADGQKVAFDKGRIRVTDETGHVVRELGEDASWDDKLDAFDLACEERLGEAEYRQVHTQIQRLREIQAGGDNGMEAQSEKRSLLEFIGAKAEAVNEIRDLWLWILPVLTTVLNVVTGQ